MTRPIVLILEVIALLFILRTSFVQYFLADIQRELSDWLVDVSQYAEQKELAALRTQLQPYMQNMQSYQKGYIADMTASRSSLNHFYHAYCLAGDKNPYVYGASLRLICEQIKRAAILPGQPDN